MIVIVTQEDIANGKRRAATGCPLALAIERATGRHASVGPQRVSIGWHKSLFLPPTAYNFRQDFDNGVPVQPFTFDLDYLPSDDDAPPL